MQSVDPGVLPNSYCFSYTPSELAKRLYYYPVWCGHYFCNANYFMKRKSYPYLLILYVINGKFNLEYEGLTLTAHAGEVIFIDCQKAHYYYASEGLEFLYIHFDGNNSHELCQQITETHGYLYHNSKTNTQIGEILYSVAEKCNKNHVICAPAFSLIIYQLLMAVSSAPTDSEQHRSAVLRSINYIKSNANRKITLEELSKHVNLSRYYFSHLFKAETGYSPREYIVSTRLDKAKILLKTTRLSIAEIAYEIGYDNSGSFINIFCSKVGISPSMFRITS